MGNINSGQLSCSNLDKQPLSSTPPMAHPLSQSRGYSYTIGKGTTPTILLYKQLYYSKQVINSQPQYSKSTIDLPSNPQLSTT